jgi:hypothetical protein
MKFKVKVQVKIKDKNGKVVFVKEKLCKSYVRQIIDILNCAMGNTTVSTKNTSGGQSNEAVGSYFLRVTAAANDSTYGVQVGKGANGSSAAVTISDFVLQSLIAHGNTSGLLSYGAVSVGSVAIVGSTAKFTIARTFTNNSGADITPQEVGLVVSDAINKFLIERSLLQFTIANGQSGTVTYTISVTV